MSSQPPRSPRGSVISTTSTPSPRSAAPTTAAIAAASPAAAAAAAAGNTTPPIIPTYALNSYAERSERRSSFQEQQQQQPVQPWQQLQLQHSPRHKPQTLHVSRPFVVSDTSQQTLLKIHHVRGFTFSYDSSVFLYDDCKLFRLPLTADGILKESAAEFIDLTQLAPTGLQSLAVDKYDTVFVATAKEVLSLTWGKARVDAIDSARKSLGHAEAFIHSNKASFEPIAVTVNTLLVLTKDTEKFHALCSDALGNLFVVKQELRPCIKHLALDGTTRNWILPADVDVPAVRLTTANGNVMLNVPYASSGKEDIMMLSPLGLSLIKSLHRKGTISMAANAFGALLYVSPFGVRTILGKDELPVDSKMDVSAVCCARVNSKGHLVLLHSTPTGESCFETLEFAEVPAEEELKFCLESSHPLHAALFLPSASHCVKRVLQLLPASAAQVTSSENYLPLHMALERHGTASELWSTVKMLLEAFPEARHTKCGEAKDTSCLEVALRGRCSHAILDHWVSGAEADTSKPENRQLLRLLCALDLKPGVSYFLKHSLAYLKDNGAAVLYGVEKGLLSAGDLETVVTAIWPGLVTARGVSNQLLPAAVDADNVKLVQWCLDRHLPMGKLILKHVRSAEMRELLLQAGAEPLPVPAPEVLTATALHDIHHPAGLEAENKDGAEPASPVAVDLEAAIIASSASNTFNALPAQPTLLPPPIVRHRTSVDLSQEMALEQQQQPQHLGELQSPLSPTGEHDLHEVSVSEVPITLESEAAAAAFCAPNANARTQPLQSADTKPEVDTPAKRSGSKTPVDKLQKATGSPQPPSVQSTPPPAQAKGCCVIM